MTRLSILLLLAVSVSVHAQNLAEVLKPKLEGKVLQLRTPDPSKELEFDSSGSPKHQSVHGLISLDSHVLVKKVELKGKDLVIRGERMAMSWNEDKRAIEFGDINIPVTVKIALEKASATTESEFASVFFKVFLNDEERNQHSCSEEGSRAFFDATRIADKKKGSARPTDMVTVCFPSGYQARRVDAQMTAPRAVYAQDPEYSMAARQKKIQGTAVILTAIDEHGIVEDAILIRSVDPSLNYSSLAAIRDWRFRPATLDGKPVACAVKIDVNFRLY